MENNYFDKNIRDSLKDFGVDYTPRDWELFERKLDADGAASDVTNGMDDIYLDGMAFDNLNRLDVPYEPAHWELMSDRLDEEFSVAGKLIKYKVIEAALMLLAIFTLFQFLPLNKKGHTSPTAEQLNIVSSANDITYQPSTTTKAILDVKEKSNPIALNNNSSTSQNKKTKTTSSIIPTPSIDNIASSIPPTIQNELIVVPTVDNSKAVTIIKKEDSIKSIKNSFPAESDFITLDKGDVTLAKKSILEEVNILIPSLAIDDKVLETKERTDELPLITLKNKKKKRLRVGMFSIADYNFIMTPYDIDSNLPAYGRWAPGYGGGITVGIQYNKRFELETGFLYTTKKYAPQRFGKIVSVGSNLPGGFEGIGLKAVELNMLTIPVNVRFSFNSSKNNKWQMYVLSGASLHLAVAANYDREFYGNLGSFGGGFFTTSAIRNAESKFKDGILEGGSFKENRYLSANLGLGVERYLSPRWSLFAQPTYQHQLINKGLGPKNDRINSFSILFGGKVSL